MHNILIVEDEEFLLDAYEAKLSKSFSVRTARDGNEALKSVSEKIPDLIILDLIMPNKDGIAVLKELKSNPTYASIPVLIASNIDKKDILKQALELGATSYFVKSNISIHSLIDEVKKILK